MEFIDDGLPTKMVFKEDVKEAAGDESREGWRGVGAPRRAHNVGRDKPYADGGDSAPQEGGRKHRGGCREGFAMELLDQARTGCRAAVEEAPGGTDGVLDLMVKLSIGRMSGPPFPDRRLAWIREWIANRLSLRPEQCGVDECQVMRLGMLSAVLKELQDPGWEFVEEIGSGVKLGVDVELPRTPAMFEEKVQWNLVDPDDRMANVSEKCGTLEENMSEVRKLFEKERSLGWTVEMSDKEAQEAYGEKLYIASLAVVTEKIKLRLVHDATNKVQVNNRMRVRDQARSPGTGAMRTLLREWQERRGGAKMFAVIGEASKSGIPRLPTGTRLGTS